MNQLARQNIMGIKPYIPGKPIEEIARELGIKEKIIKLASNENPLGPSRLAINALKRQLKNFNLYPDDNCYYLTKELARRFNIKDDEIILGNGSVEVLELVTQAFVNRGDEIVMAEDSFVMYQIVTAIAEGVRKAIPLKDFRHNLDAMAEAITPKTKAVLIANPNNPTGTMNTAEEVQRFMDKVPDNVIVVLDEAYREYIQRPDFPDSFRYFREGKNVIILRTFSKIYGLAGLRIGYGIANRDIIEALRKVRLPFNVNSAAQLAAVAALDDELHIRRSIEVNEAGKKYLYERFKKMGLPYVPTEANFIFVQPQPLIDSHTLVKELMKRGLIVRDMSDQDKHIGVRITIGTERQNRKLVKAIKEILKRKGNP